MLVRSLDFAIAVMFGCHSLLKHLSTLLMRSSLGNIFPNDARWLTICVNLFCISYMVSFWFILKSSYSCVRVFILDLFTSVVPSWVTCNVSHISFVFLQFETLKYSSNPNTEVIIFLVFKLYCTFLLPPSLPPIFFSPLIYIQLTVKNYQLFIQIRKNFKNNKFVLLNIFSRLFLTVSCI